MFIAQNRARWCGDGALFVFEGCSVRISAEIPDILTENFRGFLQYFQAKTAPNLLTFIIHRSMLCSLYTDNIVK